MKDENKSKGRLINELSELRGRIAELEASEADYRRTEDELLLHREVVKNMAEGICLVRASDAMIVYANPKFEKMFGYGPGELNGKPVTVVNYEEQSKRAQQVADEIIVRLTRYGEATYEVQNIKKDGTRFWCRANTSTFDHPEYGKVWIAVYTNINESKLAEEVLRNSEERFRTSVENMMDCFGIYSAIRDESGRITDFQIDYINNSACENNRMTREEQIGKRICELLPAHRETGLFEEYCKLVETGKQLEKLSLIYEDAFKNERLVRAFDIRATKLGDGFAAAWRDVTERKQVEEELRESEEKYRSLFENMRNGFAYCEMIFDENNNKPIDFIYLEINAAFERLTGLKREDVIGKKVTEVIPTIKDKNPELFDIYGEVALTGKGTQFDIYFEPLNIWLSISVYSPRKGYFAAVFENITKRKKVEDALIESEERYRALFQGAAEGILVEDTETKKFEYANPALCKMLGYTEEELKQMGVSDIHPRKDLEYVISEFEAQARGEKTLSSSIPCLRKDSTIIYADINTAKILLNDRECNVAFLTDITERKRVEGALREAYNIINRSPAVAFLWKNDEGRPVEFVSNNVRELFGYTAEEFTSGKVIYETTVHPDDRERGAQEITTYSEEEDRKDAYCESYRIITKDGKVKWLDEKTCTRRDNKGNITHYEGIVVDITERMQAAEALRESEEKYRSFVENFQGIAFRRKLKEFVPVFFHGAVEEITGYSAEEFVAAKSRWDQIVYPEDLADFQERAKEAIMSPGLGLDVEYRIVRRDGQIRWVQESVHVVTDNSGKPLYADGVIYDITERKRAEHAVRESEGRYRDIFHNSLVSLWEEDISELRTAIDDLKSQGVKDFWKYMDEHSEFAMQATKMIKVLDVNDATMKLYGAKTKEQLLGSLDKIATLESLSVFKKEIIAIAGGQRYIETEVAGQTLQGERIDLLIKLNIPSQREESRNMMVSIMDITNRKQMEETLRKAHDALANAQQIAHLGSWSWNLETDQLKWSNEMYRIYGLGEHHDLLTAESVFTMTHPDDIDRVRENTQRGLREGKPIPIEFRIIRADKRSRVVYAEADLEFGESGEPVRIIGIIHDITERKSTEEALRESEEQLRQAQKLESVGRLAGGIAHDFNNLLTTIIGYSELISMEQDLTDTTREGIREIKSSAERAATLTQQLLAFSRKQVLQPQVIDLNRLITRLGKMLRRLVSEDIDITTKLDSNLGKIKADPGQVEQVIMNLVVNARDAMPGGGTITIETQGLYLDEGYHQHHPEVTPGDYILLAVSDTGHGMDEKTRKHIFEPFFTTKEVGKGTGLGLSTVYGIVKQSGGYIWVYSEPEQGTTFKIYLPRLTGTKKQQESLPGKGDPMGGAETILLVEDEEALRKMAGKILEGYGYSVVEAKNGMDALEIVNKEDHPEIDLLVTDVIMPKMGGKELSEKLLEKYPKLRVLYISGYTDNAIAHHGVLDEGVSFLQKPFSSQSLAEKVREILDEG